MSLNSAFRSLLGVAGFRNTGDRGLQGKAREEATLLRKVLEKSNQVIWVDSLDKGSSILNAGSYENLYDRPQDRLRSNPLDWMNAIHPTDRPGIEARLHLQSTGNFDVQYRVVHQDGSTRWLRDRAFILRDDAGVKRYLAGNVSDITDRIELEERTLHDQKIKAIGELSGGICHDFNNVLAVILGNLELLLSEDVSPSVTKRLETALEAVTRGSALTHRLLAYSRKQPLSPSSIDPANLLNELNGLLASSLSEAIELEVISGAGLWQCYADKAELQTVLLNLVINAQQATQLRGKITIEVFNARIDEDYARVNYDVEPGQYVCFAVTDDGPGMTPEVAEQAFDPFFTTKDAGRGSGLGLSMAYGYAKQSGGHIKIYTEIDKGTTVKLYLPRSQQIEAVQASCSARQGSEILKGLSVLIVDNDDAIRETVTALFVSLGCVAVSVGTADEALSLIDAGNTFDLQVLDVVLGRDKSGPDCAITVRNVLPDISTVFMSGYTENAIIHGGQLDGGVILVQKPFTRDAMLSACVRAIGQSS